jgi:hypothetical protein
MAATTLCALASGDFDRSVQSPALGASALVAADARTSAAIETKTLLTIRLPPR